MKLRYTTLQTPLGSYDFLPRDAAHKRQIEEKLADLFSQWGYGEIITPTFEFYDSLELGDGPEMARLMYRFFDRDGHALALRPDVTTPIARVVATRFRNEPKPLKFFYLANVFRYENPHFSKRREFYQGGIELIGDPGSAADAEVIALAAKSLQAVGVDRFRIDIGHLGYYQGIMEELDLPSPIEKSIRTALLRRDYVLLRDTLSAPDGIPEKLRTALLALPDLRGDAGVLRRAEALVENPKSRQALSNLSDILVALRGHGIDKWVYIDLGMIKDIDYYTGMVLEGYTPEHGFTICTGGRYDNLIGQFGYPCPATGFALGIERLMLAVGGGELAAGNKQSYPGLTLAVPKGRLFGPMADLLRDAGFISDSIQDSSRKLIIEDADKKLRLLLAKPSDIPTYVEYGVADLGIVGKDKLVESGKDVAELLDLGIGRCRMVVAVSERSGIGRVQDLSFNSRVATSYPLTARRFFSEHGIQAEVVELHGSIELGPIVGLADAIVDITETGTTLRENGLVTIADVLDISARLIANRVSHKIKHEQVNEFVARLRDVLVQRGSGTCDC